MLFLVLSLSVLSSFSTGSLKKLSPAIFKKSFNFIGTAIVCSSFCPERSLAVEASKLFAEAEQAILVTGRDYKSLENEWSGTKKLLNDEYKGNSKIVDSLKLMDKDVSRLSDAISKVSSATLSGKISLEAEIEILKASTGEKYAAVEGAQSSGAKIGVVQKLFKAAENEAALFSQDEKILKYFLEYDVSTNTPLVEKAQKAYDSIKTIVAKVDEVQSAQTAAANELADGLQENIEACSTGGPTCGAKEQNGAAKFKRAMGSIEKAQTKFSQAKKDFEAEVKLVQALTSEADKAAVKLATLLDEANAFESNTKLSLRSGKSVIKMDLDATNEAAKIAHTTQEKAEALDARLNGKDSKSEEEKEKQLKESLKHAQASLESAEKSGKQAGKLLQEAKIQGDKEVALFRKYAPAKSAATASSAPAPATSQLSAAKK